MRLRSRAWVSSVVLFACGPKPIDHADDVGESESSSSSSSTGSSSEDDSTGSSSEDSGSELESSESGPTPDEPDDLPDGCVPVEFLAPDDRGGLPDGTWSGWMHCNDSFFRIEAIDCPSAAAYEPCLDPNGCDACEPDEQCLDWYGGSGFCFCGHNCTGDADCGNNEICACRSGVVGHQLVSRNTCLPADCAGQTDCPALADEPIPRCRLGVDLCGSPESVHCRTATDDCTFDEDCANQWCRYDPGDERWSCDEPAICE
ncbi:hypothetical protein ACNOYE_19750 [Nannocystaceae bacterium ST9]